MAENKSIEAAFAELDRLIADMENRDTSLEDSFAAYQKGMELIKFCNEKVDKLETEIEIIEEKASV